MFIQFSLVCVVLTANSCFHRRSCATLSFDLDRYHRLYVLCVVYLFPRGTQRILLYFAVVVVASFALRLLMARENARRDSLERQITSEKDVIEAEHEHNQKDSRRSGYDDEPFTYEDLTDWEQEKFKYVL